MSPSRAPLAALVVGVAALAQAACRGEAAPEQAPLVASAPPPPRPSAAPLDHLASDELVEGEKKAFGLALPRDLRVDGAFADLVLASGQLPVHPLAKYFRARLSEGSMREGDEAASFEHVHVPGKPGSEYSVHIALSGSFTRVEIRDTTPKALPSQPDDAARWRQAGLTPQGKLLDPAHLE